MDRLQVPTRDRLLIGLLGIALTARLIPFVFLDVNTSYPLGGGGFYYHIAALVAENGFGYFTTIPYYTTEGIPFAYPPLVFYVTALLGTVTPLSILTIHTYLPIAASFGCVLGFYAFTGELLEGRTKRLLATVIYASIPASFVEFVPGDGLIESVGTFLFLLAATALLRSLRSRATGDVLLAGIVSGILTLSSPGGAYAFALFALAVLVSEIRDADRLKVMLLVAAIGAVVSSPWWVTVIHEFGLSTLLNAFQSRQSYLLSVLGTLAYSNPLGGTTFWGALAFLGSIAWVSQRRFVVPLFFGLTLLAGEIAYVVPVAGALLGALAITDVVVPGLEAVTNEADLSWSVRRTLVVTTVALLLVHGTGQAALATTTFEDEGAQPGVVDAIERTSRETPAASRFFIVNPEREEHWWVADWFPALAERTAIDVPYGTEWTGEFTQRYEMDDRVNEANTLSELRDVERTYDVDATHVFVRKGEQTQSLVSNLQSRACTSTVIESKGVVVFDLRSCEAHDEASSFGDGWASSQRSTLGTSADRSPEASLGTSSRTLARGPLRRSRLACSP